MLCAHASLKYLLEVDGFAGVPSAGYGRTKTHEKMKSIIQGDVNVSAIVGRIIYASLRLHFKWRRYQIAAISKVCSTSTTGSLFRYSQGYFLTRFVVAALQSNKDVWCVFSGMKVEHVVLLGAAEFSQMPTWCRELFLAYVYRQTKNKRYEEAMDVCHRTFCRYWLKNRINTLYM